MNHPIKRFKSDDSDYKKINRNKMTSEYDLYSGQNHIEHLAVLNNLNQNISGYGVQNIKHDSESLWKNCDEQKKSNNIGNCSKDIKSTDSENDKVSTDNLFTSEGLQPSYADLNKIFDNSDDNSNDDHVSFKIKNLDFA